MLLLLLLLIFIVLSIPSVQTVIANKVTESLNQTYGTQISINKIGINWRGEVDIREVLILDHHDDTLIFSKKIQTSLISLKKITEGDLHFGDLLLDQAKLYITTYKGENTDNLSYFADSFKKNDTTIATKPFVLETSQLNLNESILRIKDYNLENNLVLELRNINLEAQEFLVLDSDISAQINNLSFIDERDFELQKLSGNFKYTTSQLAINNLDLKTEKSYWKGDLVMDYPNGMSDFVNQVQLNAIFNEASFASEDLNLFYPEFGDNINLKLKGSLIGVLNNFNLTDASLKFLNTNIEGDFIFKNLLNEKEIFIAANNHNVQSNFFDLRKVTPNLIGSNLPNELKQLNNFSFIGNTNLQGDLLQTNSILNSALGQVKTQLQIGNISNVNNAFYEGNAQFNKFNLGKLLGTTSLGTLNANLDFDGRGFTAKAVNSKLKGKINSFYFEGYNYQNIKVEGYLKNPIFDGKLNINDPNLRMNFKGLVDISQAYNQYDFEADIEFAELNKLNLFKRDSVSVFAGRIVVDMDGTTINDAKGNIHFYQTFYQTATKDYFFDDFDINSSFENEERIIKINSPDIINGKIRGKFLIEDIPYLFRNAIGSIYTNYIPIQVTTDQYINYEIEVYNKIIEVFVPQLQLGQNTRIKGEVYSDESKFKLDFKSPELIFNQKYLGNVNLQLDNDNPLYNAYLSVDSLYTGTYNLTNINLINKTLKDTLYIQSRFNGGKTQADQFNLSLYHTINPEGKSVVGVKKSKINYLGNDWFLNRENNKLNKITFDDNFNEIKLDSLTIRHNDEIIQLSGIQNDKDNAAVDLQFSDVDIGKLLPVVDTLNLKGFLNGNLSISKTKGAYLPKSDVKINDISLNDINFGNLILKVTGNSDLSNFKVFSSLENKNFRFFEANGAILVENENPKLDINVNFNDLNLQAFSPLGGEVISNLRGLLSGNIKVNGAYNNPNTQGRLRISDGGLKIPYLNVDMDLDNNTTLFIDKNNIRLGSITVTDTKYKTEATLTGGVGHNNFSNWNLDLNLNTANFLVLDTPPDEEELYYGTAFIKGASTIKGPVDELVINVNATTQPNTYFKIPISDAVSIGDDSFVRFISPAEKKARINGETYVAEEIKGLALNFELDINDNAEVEVLVDQENNSTLKGRGAGILLLEINTLGKFKMWGDFLITEGKYDLRYKGLVDKTIDVLPGGNITWDGEPTKARLDLTARYTQDQVNPSSLLDNPNLNTTVDVEVLVKLTGEIMKPDLDFELYFPRVSSVVKDELEDKIRTKEQRQIQAIFLASTGSFQSDGAAGQNALANTITERVNKLVADIFADSDSKFKVLPTINTRTVSLDQQLEYQLGVELSSKISERILVNGRVAVPVGGANESVVAGDIEVQWLVNSDGSLRMNFFSRQAALQFIGEDQIFEQGAGISYSVDFDTFNELMKKIFKKKLTLEAENEIPIIPDDDSFPYEQNTKGIKED